MSKKKKNASKSLLKSSQVSDKTQTARNVPSFSADPPEAFDPSVYSDNEISEAGDLVKRFFDGIVIGAPAGTHRIVSACPMYSSPAVIIFHKSQAGTISAENTLHESFIKMTAMILRSGNFSSTLQSFINEDINDSAGLMQDNSAQEIRAWSVSISRIHGLNTEEISDVYVRDLLAGKIAKSSDTTSYLSAWKI